MKGNWKYRWGIECPECKRGIMRKCTLDRRKIKCIKCNHMMLLKEIDKYWGYLV